MKIVVLDGYGLNPGDLSWNGFESLGDCTVYDRTPSDMVIERAREAEIVLTNKTVLSASHLEQLPLLRYIGVLATGYNVVDIEAASLRGIVVTNIPAYSTDSVAQLVFAHLLNIASQVGLHSEAVRAGAWSACPDFCFWETPIFEIAGKTIGIVGLGNIGNAVARIAHAFGMNVIASTGKRQDELPEYITAVDRETLWRESDVISLHCPLTPNTKHLINAETLRMMKPTAILINTGRGPLVDEQALADALNEGRIHAAATDVLSTEPPAADNPLLTARNCFITPHIAWATLEARTRLMRIAEENLKSFLNGTPVNRVN